MYLIIERSVLKMIPVNISLSSEESITDDNIGKKQNKQTNKKRLSDELPNYPCIKRVGCVLEMTLFNVRSGGDILIEIVFNVEY